MKTPAIALVLSAVAASASAQNNILSFTYSDLNGSFSRTGANDGVMTALAASSGALQTAGDVTRLVGSGGSALFEAGFKNTSTADAQFNIVVSAINDITKTALGNGTFTLTDVDGDTITGQINGSFLAQGSSFIFFNGVLNAVAFNDNTDGLFEGSLMGAADLDFSFEGPYTGALVQLTFGQGNFFASDFSSRATLASGLIVPAAGPTALLGFAGLAAARRRR